MKILSFFQFFWVIFAHLDPDPQFVCGSGSRSSKLMRIHADPDTDPKPCHRVLLVLQRIIHPVPYFFRSQSISGLVLNQVLWRRERARMCEQRKKKMREHRKEKKTKFSKIDDLSSCLVLFTIYFVIFLRISVKLWSCGRHCCSWCPNYCWHLCVVLCFGQHQCCGSMTFWYGSGFADPCL
jgi:hypothetical protein